MKLNLRSLADTINRAPLQRVEGRLVKAIGPMFEAEFPGASVGALAIVEPNCLCEVVGFQGRRTLLMPLENNHGLPYGSPVHHKAEALTVKVGDELIGRVVDSLGRPLSGLPLTTTTERRVTNKPPPALDRSIISESLETGIKVIDGLMTIGQGQRMAILSGSGVGKSTLLGMLARNVNADVTVICLVGERSREVREFLELNLGEEGLKKSVVVVATSDTPPAFQVKAPFTATAIAEYFRDQGKRVLLLVDSLTRMAMAQRQIGLASHEPPTTRGYTPSVFGMLPRLLERAGPGTGEGSITGIYSVLVEGNDIDDPIADAVRGVVDGHIILSRRLATHGHFPAIDVLSSLSRLMEQVTTEEEMRLSATVRAVMATWEENEELIRLGAYRAGSSPEVDQAIAAQSQINALLRQQRQDRVPSSETSRALAELCANLTP